MNRGNFLTTSAPAATALAAHPTFAADKPVAKPRVKLAVATHSNWHSRDPKVSIESVIVKYSALSVEGVNILYRDTAESIWGLRASQ